MKDHLSFETVEEGEATLVKHTALRDQMGGALWWGVTNDECEEIKEKILSLQLKANKEQ